MNAAAAIGLMLCGLTLVCFVLLPHGARLPEPASAQEAAGAALFARKMRLLQGGVFTSALLLCPWLFRRRLPTPGQWTVAASLTAVSAFVAAFIVHFGAHQIGAWDSGNLIDSGWRQILGQRPYVDYLSPNPPFFDLGVFRAFQIFGVRWAAQTDAIALYAVATALWLFWLLRRLSVPALLALPLVFSAEAVTSLSTCYWWYNNTTSLMSGVFLLSALACARPELPQRGPGKPVGLADWWSYAVSFSLLALMKPNIAGLTLVLVGGLLFVAARDRRRMLLFTAVGAALCIASLLANHVAVLAMIASYRAASLERGGLSHYGLTSYNRWGKTLLLLWTLLLALPLASLLPQLRRAWAGRHARRVAGLLLLASALPITLYGMMTNGEVKDSETAILVLACGLVAVTFPPAPRWRTAVFVSLVAAMVSGSIVYGAARERLRGIGYNTFFAYGNSVRLRGGFFAGVTGTAHMQAVLDQMHRARVTYPGSLFLGPRLEFGYAELGAVPPRRWPVYFQPGTSFARSRQGELVAWWRAQRFQTLIFLPADRTFYPDALTQAIDEQYRSVPGYRDIEVYERREP